LKSIRWLLPALSLVLAACAGPQVTRVQPLLADADAPYGNVLVVSLFKEYDARRYLEAEIVKELRARGVAAVASTSLMDTRTPVTRETFVAMVESQGSDAVLLTQLINFQSKAEFHDVRPEATYNVWPTYYYNVWNVELTEYVSPPTLDLKHSIVLAAQVFSTKSLHPVWAIETDTVVNIKQNERGDTSIFTDEAKSIVGTMSRDGLLAP